MMCDAMRERMLDAEVDELEGRGTSLLAVHVRECESCAAVARGIVRDTRVLAAVSSREPFAAAGAPSGRWRGGSYLMIGAATAATAAIAASVLFVVVPAGHSDAPAASSVAASSVATSSVASAPVASTPDAPTSSASTGGDTVKLTPLPIAARRFADATPVAAVLLTPSTNVALPRTDQPAVVRVDPPEGVGAAVMQPSNPLITVVVLYPTSSGMKR